MQPFSLGSAKQLVCPFRVGNLAGVVPEIKFGQIAVKMGFAHVVERAVDAPLEYREI